MSSGRPESSCTLTAIRSTAQNACCHSSEVRTWQDLEGDSFTVIGGYESAADAAVSLVQLEKNVTVLARDATWNREDPDPSISLSPFSRERLEWADSTGSVSLVDSVDITSVRVDGDAWVVQASDGREWASETRPILATGFKGSLSHLDGMIEYNEDGAPSSRKRPTNPRLCLACSSPAPLLEHRGVNFCFIYKFRQRFAIVADSIAQRLGNRHHGSRCGPPSGGDVPGRPLLLRGVLCVLTDMTSMSQRLPPRCSSDARVSASPRWFVP